MNILFDPTNAYREYRLGDLQDALGFVPGFFSSWREGVELADHMRVVYAQGGGWQPTNIDNYRFHPNGIYEYPDDPPQYPYAKYVDLPQNAVAYQYPSAFVMVVWNEHTDQERREMARMD